MVEGKAIHSTLKVITCFKSFADLRSNNKSIQLQQTTINLQLSMDQGSFLIMDEFSVIVCCLMTDLKQSCHEDKAEAFRLLIHRRKAMPLPAELDRFLDAIRLTSKNKLLKTIIKEYFVNQNRNKHVY